MPSTIPATSSPSVFGLHRLTIARSPTVVASTTGWALPTSWLRVFRSVDAMRLGHGGRQARQTEAVRSEKCVGRRGRAWDGLWAIAVCFTRALQRCAGHVNRRFLLILQEVRTLGKTRNQFHIYVAFCPHASHGITGGLFLARICTGSFRTSLSCSDPTFSPSAVVVPIHTVGEKVRVDTVARTQIDCTHLQRAGRIAAPPELSVGAFVGA